MEPRKCTRPGVNAAAAEARRRRIDLAGRSGLELNQNRRHK